MTESRDPRTRRTVAALRAALRASLAGGPLEAITVSELCRTAEVQRTTFYTHYASVAELLEDMLVGELDALFTVDPPDDASPADLDRLYNDGLRLALEVVAQERPLYRAAFGAIGSFPFRRAVRAQLARRISAAAEIWTAHGRPVTLDHPSALAFTAGGLMAAIETWAMSDDTESVEWARAIRDQLPPWWPRG